MKPHLAKIMALIGFGLLASQTSFGKDLSCSDWSFNSPHCPAYIAPHQAASGAAPGAPQAAQCSDWSFNDPHCAAYISPSSRLASANRITRTSQSGPACADWSFDDPTCPAYIKR